MKKFLSFHLLLLLFISITYSQKSDSTGKVNEGVLKQRLYKFAPADNRLMLMPNANPLREGEWQFNVIEVFVPYVMYGASSYINIGAGGIPFYDDYKFTFLYGLTAKVIPYNTPDASIALGGAVFGATDSKTLVSTAYIVGTFGNSLNSVTVGGCKLFSNDEKYNRPAFMLGGHVHVYKSISLLSENIIALETERYNTVLYPSLGVRITGQSLAADFGAYGNVSGGSFSFYSPWIGFSYRF